jgi:cell division septation protein DedD
MAVWRKHGAGDRVLESKHVIGLFLLMLLFSGVFFTLGYVMGRNQYDGQVRAAANAANRSEPVLMQKADPAPKNAKKPSDQISAPAESDPSTNSSNPDWEFYANNKSAKTEPHLEPAAKAPIAPPISKPLNVKSKAQPQPVPAAAPAPAKNSKSTASTPPVPNGALVLQVAALLKQDDALGIASSLQKKHYMAYVQPPTKDKYYRVQVGPFHDQKTADAVKKGLEGEGFKAFYLKH